MSEYHGLLLINKPSGMTSHDVVAVVRKTLNQKSVGHSGTLDPMAEGLMILLLGEATKLSQYILEGNKSYRVIAKFGIVTDTLDVTGTITATTPINHSEVDIANKTQECLGELNLPVPMYSAVKVGGQKMYDMAREGKSIEQPMKIMKFWELKTLQIQKEEAEFHLKCSKGSYVRAWVHLLGEKLGCGAAMSALTRTWSDPYFLEQAMTLEELQNEVAENKIPKSLIPVEKALPNSKKVRVKGYDMGLLMNGQISHGLRSDLIRSFNPDVDSLVQVFNEDESKLLALIGLEPNKGFVIRRGIRY